MLENSLGEAPQGQAAIVDGQPPCGRLVGALFAGGQEGPPPALVIRAPETVKPRPRARDAPALAQRLSLRSRRSFVRSRPRPADRSSRSVGATIHDTPP